MYKPIADTAKAATLARVRNNQRHCRERKREYVIELEKKIQDLQDTTRENAKDHCTSVERLEAESRELRELVANTGLNQSRIPENRDSQD
jgi:uncharacterized membrane protein YgaE (UPF0421/DUF939 family)